MFRSIELISSPDTGLSPTAKIALGLIAFLFFSTNLSLWLAWRKRNNKQSDWLGKISNAVRDPWENENKQLDELSKRVARLREENSKPNENEQ